MEVCKRLMMCAIMYQAVDQWLISFYFENDTHDFSNYVYTGS